jgi:DNA processing protein
MEREELSGWLRLQLSPWVGNTSARQLLAAFGLPTHIFEQTTSALSQVVTPRQVAALQQEPVDLQPLLQTTWDWLQADLQGRRVIALGDPVYPLSLLNMEDPPVLLYAMGAPQAWHADGLATCASRAYRGLRAGAGG